MLISDELLPIFLCLVVIDLETSFCAFLKCCTFVYTGNAGISTYDDGKCGIEGHLSSACGDSTAVNGGTVGNGVVRFLNGITDRHLPPAPVNYNKTDNELMNQGPAVPLLTVADNMIGSVPALVQMPYMTGNIVARDNAPQHGSVVQICVFSTELANCAAESVRVGRYDNIIDFHQDYCTVPVSQVYTAISSVKC